MFNPKSCKDRINYGNVLMPPPGFHLEKAISTTYSLDLETLTAIAMSIGIFEDTDSELINNSLCMLNALEKVSNKITVFCEAGQIKLPSKSNALFLLLEKMVVPVKLEYNEAIKAFPAFHPKMWLLEYSNDSEKRYKFAIMSRNLTFDHSWDVACSLDGKNTGIEQDESKPLQAFLIFLKDHLDGTLSNNIRQYEDINYFVGIISKVKFEIDARFSSFRILPMGIGENGFNMSADSLFVDSFKELVVVSPFISASVIRELNDDSKSISDTKRTLITRRTEISKLSSSNAGNFQIYVMKDRVVIGESSLSEEGTASVDEDITKQDIHAKIYFRNKNKNVDLYLGSMNATDPAINANVELMLQLHTRENKLSGDAFLNELMCENRNSDHNPFELVKPIATTETVKKTTEDYVNTTIKKACRLNMNAVVFPVEGKYAIKLSVDNYAPLNCDAKIRPLRAENAYLPLNSEIVFTDLELLDLSEFYVLSVSLNECTLQRVIMIPTKGILVERDAEIVKSVVKYRRDFIEYIAFILGDDYYQTFLENKKTEVDYGQWGERDLVPAVYETILIS